MKKYENPDMKTTKAVVLLSGGQDSVTVLAHAVSIHGERNVFPLNLNYGQQHIVEQNCAERCADDVMGIDRNPIQRFTLQFLAELSDSALLHNNSGKVTDAHRLDSSLPASFVPNRNAALLTVAHGYAMKIGAEYVYGGMCETDYSGYPDCRASFIQALETALNLGSPKHIIFRTPLMYLDKAQTFEMANNLDVLSTVIHESHTCYEGDRTTLHVWGYGCGKCPACEVRRAGFEKYVGAL
jgi:7-cyano-7-deazaguanine synthase